MDNELRRAKAIESVDTLIADIEKSVKRGAAVFGAGELLTSMIPAFVGGGVTYEAKIGRTYTGERRDLKALLGHNDWVSAFSAIPEALARGWAGEIKPGDFIRFPVKVSDAHFGGMKFEALDLVNTEAIVVQVSKDKVIFNFEEVLFFSAINPGRTSEGGFSKSVLSAYLNERFIDAFSPIADILAPNKDGQKITLPTQYEIFGDDDNGNAVNWEDEPRQLEYFKNIKNRIRVKDNDTKWWWLSTPYAAYSTYFAIVNYNGDAGGSYASFATGGVAPAFCVR